MWLGNASLRQTTLPKNVPNLTSAATASPSMGLPEPTTRRLLVGRKRKTPQGLGTSPPARGVQTAPHPVPPPPVVVQHLPFTGQEDSENDFIHVRPVPPDIKVSTLKSSMFYLPDANIFMDKSLPDSEPVFLSRLASQPSFLVWLLNHLFLHPN